MRGTPDAEIEKARVEAEQFTAMYDKFYVRFPFTLIEILPVGIIVTLVSAALLRKREVLPADPELRSNDMNGSKVEIMACIADSDRDRHS